MPILSHILLEAQQGDAEGGGRLTLSATDLEIGIQDTFVADVIQPGRATVQARQFYEMVRECSEDTVWMTTEDNLWIEVKCGQSRFRVAGLPPEEFPTQPVFHPDVTIPLNRGLLSGLIRKTIFACGENDPRHALNGILLRFSDNGAGDTEIRLVATDGHRLALADGVLPGISWEGASKQVILPRKMALELRKLMEESASDPRHDVVKEEASVLSLGETQAIFKYGTTRLTSRLLDGTYPPYEKVIPTGKMHQISSVREALEGGLRRVSLFAREKTGAIRFQVKEQQIHLDSDRSDMGEAHEEVAAHCSTGDFTTLFNVQYLLDALGALDGEAVLLEFENESAPFLLREKEKGFLAMVMPIRSVD